jgi:hypothetical protein
LPSIAQQRLGFKYNIFDGQSQGVHVGFRVDPQPFEGKVIAATDEAIIIKTGARCLP